MGSEESFKSEPILRYYILQNKINKFLKNNSGKRKEKYSTKKGYIMDPEWINNWKSLIKYNELLKLLSDFKIKSYKKISDDQRLLIKNFIENKRNITSKPHFLPYMKIDLAYMFNKHKKDFWELFINEKTFNSLKLSYKFHCYIKMKYIFKSSILILFFKDKLIFKMYLWYENRLINLTFIFHDKQIYEDKKDKFKKWTSENIREFLKIKSIFYNKIYTSANNNKICYIIRNESLGKSIGLNNIIKRPEELDYSLIKRTSYRGLDNVGATCYMNATLQCLANIKPVTDYLLDANNYNNLFFNEKLCPLTLEYTQVLIGLFLNQSNAGSYSPESFKSIISYMNPLFQGVQANDSKDLIIFLLEEINNELINLKNKGNNNSQNPNTLFQIRDIYDENEVYQIFLLNFKKSHSSVIGNNLCGFNKSIFVCQKCGKITTNFNIYNFLIFSLEATSNYFNLSYNNTVIPTINFSHCFKYIEKEELFQNTYCEYCKETNYSKYKEIIYKMPKYLIIILNRGRGNIFKCNVEIPEFFNASQLKEIKSDKEEIYELVGVVSHFGEGGMGGHFIAFCKHNIDNKWRCYNDSIVTLCQNDYLTKGTPYILFYKMQENTYNLQQNINFQQQNNCFQNNMNINNNLNGFINQNINNNIINNNLNNNINQNMNINFINNNNNFFPNINNGNGKKNLSRSVNVFGFNNNNQW